MVALVSTVYAAVFFAAILGITGLLLKLSFQDESIPAGESTE